MKELNLQESKEQRIARAIADLTDKERAAFKYHNASVQRKEAFDIPDDGWQSLYDLYQSGKTCEEIRRIHNPKFSLGQIVSARVVHDFNGLLDEYRRELLPKVQLQVNTVQIETASTITDMIAACNKMWGESIQRYLQTGDKAALKGTPIENMTIKNYRDLLGTLMEVTGQTAAKAPLQPSPMPTLPKSTFSPEDAAALLDEFVKG